MPGLILMTGLHDILLHDMLTRDYLIDQGLCVWELLASIVTRSCV